MITRLMVRDWGPFDQKTVDFLPRKNVVFGPNFSGKTSLVNAIFYALTGEVLAPKAKPADFAKAKSRDSIVELDLALRSGSYRIRRRPTRKQSHLLTLEDGAEALELASGSGVDQRIAELLGLQMPELTQSVFMKEGDVAEYLASSTPGKRKEFVKSLIKMDRLEEITEAAKEWQREVNAQSRELDRTLAHARTATTTLKAESTAGDKVLLEKEIEGLEARREELVEERAALKETADSLVRLEDSERRLNSLSGERDSLQGKLGTEQMPYRSVEEIRAEMELITVAAGELEDKQMAEAENTRKRDTIGGRRESIEEAVGSVEKLKEVGADECPTCHQKVTPQILDQIIAEKKRDLEAIDKELKEASMAAERASSERKAVQEALERREALARKIESIEEIKTRLEQYERETPRLEREIEDLKRRVEGAGKISEIEGEITKVDASLREALDKRDKVITNEAALKEAENRVDALEEREEDLSKKKALAKLLRAACEETAVELGSIPIKRVKQGATGVISRLGIFDGC